MEPGSDDRDFIYPGALFAQIEKLIGELHEARKFSRRRGEENSARSASSSLSFALPSASAVDTQLRPDERFRCSARTGTGELEHTVHGHSSKLTA